MKVTFKLELIGRGKNKEEAKNDAIEQLRNTIHDNVEITSWLDVVKTEKDEDEE
jgi:hypothetical protein